MKHQYHTLIIGTGCAGYNAADKLFELGVTDIALVTEGRPLSREPLEIAVCAQHCNGGIAVDRNWQTALEGLYAAGEAAGTFGVYRPGGSALNSTQVGSLRAAEHIAAKGDRPTAPVPTRAIGAIRTCSQAPQAPVWRGCGISAATGLMPSPP